MSDRIQSNSIHNIKNNLSSKTVKNADRKADIDKFSNIFMNINQKEADNRVINEVFNGNISFEDDFIFDLSNSEDLLDDLIE